MFTKYIVAYEDSLPPIDPSCLYEYVLAGNGLFVRARRQELEAMIPIVQCEVRGLKEVRPFVRMEYGKIPLHLTQTILDEFRRDLPDESLVWIRLNQGRLKAIKPPQERNAIAVRPLDPYDPNGKDAFLDIHSHNTMEPYFSAEDDRDETGFRIFAVMGFLDRRPCVAARIGIYGHYWQLEAESVFVLPQGLEDALKVLVDLAVEPEEREKRYEIHENCAAGTG
jgi:PRTRC genetic system protein A